MDMPRARQKKSDDESPSPRRKRQRVQPPEPEADSDSDAVSAPLSHDSDADLEGDETVQQQQSPWHGVKPLEPLARTTRLFRRTSPTVDREPNANGVSSPRRNAPSGIKTTRTKRLLSIISVSDDESDPNDRKKTKRLQSIISISDDDKSEPNDHKSMSDAGPPPALRRNPPRSKTQVKSRTRKQMSPLVVPVSDDEADGDRSPRRNPPRAAVKPIVLPTRKSRKRAVSPVVSDFADPPTTTESMKQAKYTAPSPKRAKRVASPVVSDFADDPPRTQTKRVPSPVVSDFADITPMRTRDGTEDVPPDLLFQSDDEAESKSHGVEDNDASVTPPRRNPRDNAQAGPSKPRRKLFRKPDVAEGAASDVDDLYFAPPPVSSKQTPTQRKKAVLQRYKDVLREKSSPRAVRRTINDAEEQTSSDHESVRSRAEEDSDKETATSNYAGSFIDDDGVDPEEAKAVDDELAEDRDKHRTIEGHLAVFIQYIVDLHFDPDLFSNIPEASEQHYRTAIDALRRRTNGFADSIRLQQWNAPFTATLDLRPELEDEFKTHAMFPTKWQVPDYRKGYGCQACWTRGDKSCDRRGQRTLWTVAGTYNLKGDTFEASSHLMRLLSLG
ncbi:hypothetical protein C8R46DRAFT_459392 [Mycena filopes]|nr:hypothetical protein C8R46DRAFT_459392 [Mycena filopes]